MLKFSIFIVFLSLVFTSPAHNVSHIPPDTVVHDLQEIVVTGKMPAVNMAHIPMSITTVNKYIIENRYQPSLLPLLNEEVPGLFITQRGVMGYGIANGAAGTINIRGIGGAPTSGVLVLIDGHPQYMGLMGHPLADNYLSSFTERVEVVRGPASMLYGSNAMGGVINIITQKLPADGRQGTAKVMYGSYKTLNIDASGSLRKKRLEAYASGNFGKSEGHRPDMEFEQLSMYGKLGYEFFSHWRAYADLSIMKAQSSNPGIISSPIYDNDAEILRGMTSLIVENNYKHTSGSMKVYTNFGQHHINDGYKANELPKLFRFNSKDQMNGLSVYQSYAVFSNNKTSIGFDYQNIGGKAWNSFINESENKQLADVFLKEFAGYIHTQQTFLKNGLILNGGIRINSHEKNGTEWVPQIALNYISTSHYNIKMIVSKGFRNPTIREMYMFPPQNPHLKAEKLWNYEISTSGSLLDGHLQGSLHFFFLEGKDMIQQIFSEGKPLNVNIGKVENTGVEVNAAYMPTAYLRISANYSYLHMKYNILAAPKNKLNVNANYKIKKWDLFIGAMLINSLYKELAPQPQTESYFLVNLRGAYNVTKKLNFFLKAENLLDREYEINAGFPMPGLTVDSGIRVNI